METDRELLELAAKAAGLDRRYYKEYLGHWGMIDDDPNSGWWNPLIDDGDALRLAVKLGMDINSGGEVVETAIYDFRQGRFIVSDTEEDARQDPYAATRRAIVCAAAEIAKQISKE